MGLKFFQTRSNAIILCDTLPTICIEKVVSVKTKEVLDTKTSKSPPPAPLVTLKAYWRKDWNSDAAASSNSSQPIQPNPFAITEQPVACNSGTLDFRFQGLLHSTVEEAEHVRVREVIHRIESPPQRDELQANLMQDDVCNPFREKSKKMIYDMGNVEHFELCDTDSQGQCSCCLSCLAEGIVCCTCGICLCHTEAMRRLNRKRFDALSISNYVIKKGCSHGARHGQSEEKIYNHQAFHAWKRCKKKRCKRRKLHRNAG